MSGKTWKQEEKKRKKDVISYLSTFSCMCLLLPLWAQLLFVFVFLLGHKHMDFVTAFEGGFEIWVCWR